ncbi:SdrD B-like domain-containing protein [Glutamicibacter arilaitensis]|nr:SdrD B-like domain-containing protein [Glutamicibacter arilaitensis]
MLAVLLSFGSVMGMGGTIAAAATPGISVDVNLGNEKFDGTSVVTENQQLTMMLQYDGTKVVPGSTVAIKLGANVSVASVPAGNDAVKSIQQDPNDPNTVLVTFADPWPAGSGQGVLALDFVVNPVENSSLDKISWSVDGEESSLEVIIKNGGDEFANVNDGSSKHISKNGNLNKFMKYDPDTQKVSVDPAVIGAPVEYTLTVGTNAANPGYAISDVLPETMSYIAGSFTAAQSTWDENGLNKAQSAVEFAPVVNGSTFAGELDLPGPSQTVITYKAAVADESARAALEAQLQAEADKVNKENGGSYRVNLKNTATLGEADREATMSIGGNIAGTVSGLPGPNSGGLKKSANWSSQNVDPAEDGTLDPAQDITYTIASDLRSWDGSNVKKTLTDNVIISDALPTQATWNTGDPSFVTATGIELEQIAPVALAAFAGDDYVGTYFVEGQKMHINIGKGTDLNVSVSAKATIHTVSGLSKGWTDVPGQSKYQLANRAEWKLNTEYGPGKNGYNNVVNLLAQESNEEGFNAPNYFKKRSDAAMVEIDPGTSAPVKYTFTVGAGKGIDLTKSTIIDYVDTKVFEVSDLEQIASQITATYEWWRTMAPEDFTVSLNDQQQLVIKLSEAGAGKVAEWGIDKQFSLDLTLNTKEFAGKQTLQIKNKATLFGEDGKALYWSEAVSEATSYGDEAEIRKSVRDSPNQDWTQNLRAEVDPDGKLVQPKYVYNVALIPHGNYTGVKIFDVVDVLPAGMKFLGFVPDSSVDSHINASMDVQDLKGNVQARYDAPSADAPSGTVVLYQKQGTVLDASQGAASVNVLVEIVDFEADVAIENIIGSTKATITPTDGYPLSISKVDAEDTLNVISDENARFQILDAEGTVVVDDVFVMDGALRVASGEEIKNVTVPAPGTYKVKEVVAPAGYELSEELLEVTVAADGSSEAAVFYNVPGEAPAKTFAVGDYVWVDGNKDGVQGDAEVLEGVKVALLDGNGEVVSETATDANGRYIFDELPAGDYQVKFELTEEQAAKYEFTSQDAGEDDATDSDADPQTGLTIKFTLDEQNTALTKEYSDQEVKATEGIDPTWDAGVVLKQEPKVSVGDYVWVDENKDGIQDDAEPGIENVVLTLVGPEGEPVIDVNGDPVGPTTTDENGFYTFENLPVLEDGQSYTVIIDQEASKEPLAPYVPTVENGTDREGDSSTWEAKSEGLTNDGDRDPTLDFGFVVKPVPTEPVEPTEPTVDPTEPTVDPTEPVEPTEPTVDPTEPTVDPTEPTVDPTEPTVDPTEPTVDPTEPTVDPTEPTVDPTEPTVDPTEPTVDPTEPTVDPTEPTVDPTEPTVDPTEPTVDPTEPTVDPTEPTVDPTEPTVDPTEPTVDPTEPTVDPTEPTVDPTEPTVDPTEPVEPTEPTVDPTEPTVDPTEPTVDPTEPTVDPTEPTVDPTEPTVEPTEPTDPVEPTDSTDPAEPTDSTDPAEPTDSTDPAEPTDSTVGSTEPSESDEAEENVVQKSTPTEDSSEAPQSSEKDDKLADTGFTAMYVLIAGLLLAAAGVLMSRRSNRRHG